MQQPPGCRAAWTCQTAKCSSWRWQDRAASNRETACIKCGAPFTKLLFYPAENGGKRARQPKGGKVEPKAPGSNGWGKAAGPRAVGPQFHQPQRGNGQLQSGDGRGKGGQVAPNSINYNRAQSDPLYCARMHLEHCKAMWGATSAKTIEAKAEFDEAQKKALEHGLHAKKLAALRSEKDKAASSLQATLVRGDEIEAQLQALQEERVDVGERAQRLSKQVSELEDRIAELGSELPRALDPGPQLSFISPRETPQMFGSMSV